MKYLISVFIIFTIAIKPILPVVNYAVNYEYISENLCENRDKPELTCHGKCFLIKELFKTQNNSTTNITKVNSIDNFIAQDIFSFKMSTIFILERKFSNTYFDFYNLKYTSTIFHPPLV
ncbi:hypothetical protein [Frigoriflavimonas asaccharolytica]|uniref:Uncharacterized protein n=1 Tax=Frigoriflavimonas asaccharolytica TaxID=2735899 RepID=A0A8J8GAU1_9FLAO|nr:hypothetical protein [Frigoriflavimonas asaccharolytica]NRS93815.1 hypothetical protein [Frigoriflavimonas asaccharolytica]